MLRDHLRQIQYERGVLTPHVVLDAARDPQHPLHYRFEWDDTLAAEKYRLHQARVLIAEVMVNYTDRNGDVRRVREYHAVHRPAGYEYRTIHEIAASRELTELVRREMERDWQTLKRRYESFVEFTQMVLADLGVSV